MSCYWGLNPNMRETREDNEDDNTSRNNMHREGKMDETPSENIN